MSVHKKKAWKTFSTYIRTRDCLKTTGTTDRGVCVTCHRTYEFNYLQAGHFLPSRGNSILFDEEGVHAQCSYCNFTKHGEPKKYRTYMDANYPQNVIEEMVVRKHQIVLLTSSEFDEIAEKYKLKTEELSNA